MLTIKTPEPRHWSRFGVFIVKFEHISHLIPCSSVSTVGFEQVSARQEELEEWSRIIFWCNQFLVFKEYQNQSHCWLPFETLCEKCPNTEFFLVGISPYSDWIWRFTPYVDWIKENMDHKRLRIWTRFTQWKESHIYSSVIIWTGNFIKKAQVLTTGKHQQWLPLLLR